MKKINLDSAKLQLKKAKISNLTKEEMVKVQGGMGFNTNTCGTSKCQTNGYDCHLNI